MGDGYVSGPDVLARSLYFRSSVTNFCTLADWFAAIRNSMAVSLQLKYSVMSIHPPKHASVWSVSQHTILTRLCTLVEEGG